MLHRAMSTNAASKPEWVVQLDKQIKENPKSVSYALSSLDNGKPKNRFVIHRGFTPSTHILLSTTDTRMPKVSQLSSDPAVEIAWWIEDPAIQFRIGGKAYVIPASNPSTEGQIKSTLQAIGAKGDEADPVWWENKREELWNKSISGHLRASFARPTPGQSLKTIDRQPEEWAESIPAESDDEKMAATIKYAKSHFAILAISAQQVDYLELKPLPNRRAGYVRQNDGEWTKEDVAP